MNYNIQTRCEAFAVYYLNHFDVSRFRRYRAFRDETCGSFVYARPYRRASASGLSRCAGRLKTREVGERINEIDEDSQGQRVQRRLVRSRKVKTLAA